MNGHEDHNSWQGPLDRDSEIIFEKCTLYLSQQIALYQRLIDSKSLLIYLSEDINQKRKVNSYRITDISSAWSLSTTATFYQVKPYIIDPGIFGRDVGKAR